MKPNYKQSTTQFIVCSETEIVKRMPSVKQTLILLPLLGLAGAAPTSLPRDLGNAGGSDPEPVLDWVVQYDADTPNGAIGRRSPQDPQGGTLTRGSGMVAEGAGSALGFLSDTSVKFVKTAPSIWDRFWSALRGKKAENNPPSAPVGPAGTLSKRRVSVAPQQGGYNEMQTTVPVSPVAKPKPQNALVAGFNDLRTNKAEVKQKNAATDLLKVQSEHARQGIEEAKFKLQQDEAAEKRKQKEWEAINTPMGALRNKVTGFIQGSGAKTANIKSPLASQGGLGAAAPAMAAPAVAAPGSVGPGSVAPASVAPVTGMPPTRQNPVTAGPAGGAPFPDEMDNFA
ncbi:hypothetical protein MCOR07_008199 [Pyricularia oryzae]|uniref:Clathrin light chain n=1 Tax=Pyricularia grisea TaxID=148305 RepID=A0ABQ8NY44_PYRGI|nr:hypothetical protein MCOR26_010950 [Pyricularia oryzae]KAI6303712.1 hypothetical protein MCOR33_001234 [Pyricularia grisea]KAI6338919.1 hypothetical protein MCOR28_007584 [Pyricularia oryzae]KAI6369308.1 hypothetical protein MCOR31_005190 [Pyricularia oryzae]KAI6439700.1 hypothetical protein MCOR22_007772 [Pyricularia oryzae]